MRRYLNGLFANKNSRAKHDDRMNRLVSSTTKQPYNEKSGRLGDYTHLDSPQGNIDVGDEDGDVPRSVSYTFRPIIEKYGERVKLEDFLRDLYNEFKYTPRIAIELCGPGRRLFYSMDGLFTRTYGITLVDVHKGSLSAKIYDDETHEVIEGDIFSEETQYKLSQKLEGAKADLIIQRAYRGVDLHGLNISHLFKAIDFYYSLLSDYGILLFDIGYANSLIAEKIAKIINKNNVAGLQVVFAETHSANSVMMIRKMGPSAPLLLPRINLRDISEKMSA